MTMIGKCHICKQVRWVKHCSHCRHWFCEDCRTKWFDRTWAFLKEKFGGKSPNCCGVI